LFFQHPVSGNIDVNRRVVVVRVEYTTFRQNANATILRAVSQRIEAYFIAGLAGIGWIKYPESIVRLRRRKIGFGVLVLAASRVQNQ